MCWNKEVSLNTFIFGTISLLFIYYNNIYTQYKLKEFINIWIYLLMFSVVSIQLLEYYIWDNINDTNINKKLSILSFILILIQPFLSLMSIKNIKNRNTLLTWYLIFVLSIISIYTFTNQNMSTSVAKNGHLKWNWIPKHENVSLFILWGFYVFFLLYPLYIEKNYTIFIFFSITFFVSFLCYLKYNTYESMWCWLSNFIIFIFLFEILIYLPYCEKSCL
jgi:hypothetical protein